MSTKTRLIFRADGNNLIGLGHVFRCLALAEILQHEFQCIFAIKEPSLELISQISLIASEIIFLPNNTNLLSEAGDLAENFDGHEIIVLDGYQFTTEYQHIIKQKGSLVVCIDDLHKIPFVADVVINVTGGVSPEAYQVVPYTRLCLGPTYALLRQPFRKTQKTKRIRTQKEPWILVCFGSTDPQNFTLQFVLKLLNLPGKFRFLVVTGSANQHRKALENFANSTQVELFQGLSAKQMASLMMKCNVALTPASTLAYEYCAVRGMLFIEKTADNQNDIYNYLLAEKMAFPADKIGEVLASGDFEKQAQALELKQHQIFNGQAEENLKNLFRKIDLQARLIFRKFRQEDAGFLFEWANDPVVRKFSFSSDPIPLEIHLNWVKEKLANPDALLLIAEINNEPAAFIRFDKESNTALISIQISEPFRGKGLGHRVLLGGLRKLTIHFPNVTRAIGFVQQVNTASVRAFEKAEFIKTGFDEELKAFIFSKEV